MFYDAINPGSKYAKLDMKLFNNQQQTPFEKKMLRLAIYELPGSILVVLGLYGRYWAEGDAFLPFLNDPQIVIGRAHV